MTVHIPYGKHTFACELSDAAVLTSHVDQLRSPQSGLEIVRRAMAAPIDSLHLEELARGKRTCTVIVSDHTRPVPSRDILPPMLEELRRGNPEIDIIDEDKNTVAAFAGEMEQAHEAGCDFLSRYCEVRAAPADIVITSNGGAPLDQNIYQCVKGLTAAEASAKEGAVLIMCAGLADGHGGEGFYRSLCDCESPDALYQSIMATPQNETIPDQWESQILARILMKHRVIFVSPHEREALLREMKLDWAPDLDTAIAMAREEKGADALVTVIPNGVSVIVKKGYDIIKQNIDSILQADRQPEREKGTERG